MNPTGHQWEENETSLHFSVFSPLSWCEVKAQILQNTQQGNSHSPTASLRHHIRTPCARLGSEALFSLSVYLFGPPLWVTVMLSF